MDQLEVEPDHSSANSRKGYRDIASNRKSIAIGILALALIGAAIAIVYVFENSDARTDEDLIKHALQQHQRKRTQKVTNVRLPNTLQPLEYRLSLIPYLNPAKNFTIDGTVAIDVLCQDVTDKIIININKITIKEHAVRVVQLDDVDEVINASMLIPIKGHEYDPDREFYIVLLEQKLQAGSKYRVYIEYVALLSDELVGFYRSSYIDQATNETRWLGITQFSPTDARRAFPSFDEPSLKARFEISLGRLENMTSLSNMNRVRTEPIEGMPGWYWDHYNKTLLMSTYLVGFAVTDFVPRETDPGLSKPKFQIWSRKDALDQTDYAAKVGPKMLAFFEEYFKIEFPLPKQDIVAVPDMRFSAMENWGLITFRELYILFDPEYSSDAAKQKIIEILGHEIAHQWFGNLVTPSWWSELWLKEGFASYVEYIGANHVEPSFRILELFLINDFQKVLRMDALNVSHPIQVPVDHPDEINQVFDAISYSKGCSLLRMMDHFLTEKTFKQGITNYLNRWKYNSTTQEYLWGSLTEQAHADATLPMNLAVGQIMDTWTLQKGYPLLRVERNRTSGNFTLSSSKFNLLPNATGDDNEYKWWIPISYASPTFNSDFSSTKPSFWIPPTIDTMEVRVEMTRWIIVNVQSTGYYRVTYDDENWSSITKQLQEEPTKIHIQNRAQLIDDVLNIARTEPRLYETAFSLTTQYIRNEREYLPWNSYVVAFNYLYNVLSKTPSIDLLKNYFRKQLNNEYERLGFSESDSESHMDRVHRVDIIEWACKVDLADCRQKATAMFAGWMNQSTENKIPLNLRRTIYCTAVANSDESVWNFALSQYLTANVASEKDILLRALTCSRNVRTLSRYLDWSITEGSGVRKQDSRSVMQNIALNEVGNGLVFKFLQRQWSRIRKYFGGGLSIDKVINDGVAQLLTTEQELQELLNFKREHDGDFGYGARAVEEAIEITRINIRWMNESYETVSSLLRRYA